MKNKEAVQKTKKYVKYLLEGAEPGHDWFHIERVWKIAKKITKEEKGDMFIVEMAALLHDVDDYKFGGDFSTNARKWLESLGIGKEYTQHIIEIIENVDFWGPAEDGAMKTLEGKIVQDADRLDALGAIGIARCFSFCGHKKNVFFDPHIKIKKNMKWSVYKKAMSPAINHFYEKLLLLKDRMHTKTAKRMAEDRHKFMEQYLKQFFNEWNGR